MLQTQPESSHDTEIEYLKAVHVQWQAVSTQDLPTMWASLKEIQQYAVANGDLLVCEGGEVGRAAVVDTLAGPAIIQNALHRVRPCQGDTRFFMYFLRHVADAGWFEVVCNRATIAHLTGEKLGALLVLTPSLLEQRAIADFLDRKTKTIDDLIQKKERLIELLQEKRQALITQAVTKGLYLTVPMKDSGIEWLGEIPAHWELAPIYARYEVQLGKMLDAKRITGEHLAPYLRNVDVQWDSINLDNLPMMDFTPTDRAKFTLEHGDLLVCEGGEVGRCAVWQGEIEECYYQKALHRVRPWSDRDNSRFLYYVMFAVAKRGVFVAQGNPNTIDHLTAEKLRRYRFPFPPRYEQDAICSHLDAAEHRAATTLLAIEQQIDRLREYRQVLISAAVTGKIDVTREG
jgi:type I restriction enzyme S subunit